MASQGVDFDFTSRGADKLASDFRKTGDNAAIAAKGARLCADALEKQRKAADVSAGATLALAKADDILKEAEHGLAEGALEAEFALKKQAEAAKKAGLDAAAAEAGVSALAGTGGIPGGGMGALIAAGVALSPIVATLGVGLGGLGLAAVGVAKPIADAAQKTGGLAANMGKLNPEQRALAGSILGLGKQYDAFQKALQPEVLGIFNQGIKLAGGLLHDIQPVAAATGKAFGTFLGQIDAEFRSRTWQDFFGFMAAQAGPDMKLLADAILPLLDTLPKLLTDIQPIAVQLLQAAGGALKLADAAVTLNDKIHDLGTRAGQSGGFMGHFADAAKQALGQVLPGIPAAQALGKWLGVLGSNSDKAGTSTAKTGDALAGAAPKAQSYAQWVAASAKATTNLANAQNAAVSTQLAYGNDILTSANDAATFQQKLKASANQIGLHTQAQRDSFGAANTYIGDLARQALAAITSGHGTDAAITAIRNGLPILDSAKTKNKQYWQEVATLITYLHKLELIPYVRTNIIMTGTGSYTISGGTAANPIVKPNNRLAAGGFISGGMAGRDSVPAMLMPGEVVVPARMVSAGAVDHLRGRLPGFASGGVVSGPATPAFLSGFPVAFQKDMTGAMVTAMRAAIKAASAAAESAAGGPGVAGPGGGAPAANAALARRLMPSWGSGAEWNAWNYLEMREAGWNQFARNPSSGAYGIPQALPPGKMGAAANPPQSNPTAQIRWMIGYIQGRYGDPVNAAAHERAFNWYARGGLVPGFASGGVAGQGAAWLKAWQTRHGGGYGAAWGPVALNQQIPEMAAAIQRAKALSGASGLSPGQHRFWAATAADETRRLGVLGKELTTERAWRTQLGLGELALDKEIRAAGNLPSLAGAVKGWKAQMGRDKARVAAISKMLGYSDAYIAAHPAAVPGPVLPTVTHTYGGDVANNLGVILAAALGPFTGAARGGMVFDRGGTLQPGWNPVYNGTGRPEPLVPARGGGRLQIEWVGGNGGDDLERWIRKNVRVRGGTGPGAVERAYGSR